MIHIYGTVYHMLTHIQSISYTHINTYFLKNLKHIYLSHSYATTNKKNMMHMFFLNKMDSFHY